MAAKGARVHIYGDWDGAGVKRAQQDLGQFQRQAQGFSGAISKSMLGVGAAFGGAFAIGSLVGNAVDFLQDAAKAAMEDQKSVVALSKALDNLGLAHSQPAIETFIGELQMATGVADDQLRPAYQKLVTATGDVAKAQDLLNLSMDISAATGKDLASVSQAMSRASLGQVSALTRLGIPLDQNIIKTKDFAAAQDVLTEKFGGQAAAAAETYAGKMARLNQAISEGTEQIGYALVGALDDAATSLGGADGFIPYVEASAEAVATFITGLGVGTQAVIDFLNAAQPQDSDGGFLQTFLDWAPRVIGFVPGLGQVATTVMAVGGEVFNLGQESIAASEQMTALAESANGGDVAMGKAAIGMGRVATAAHDATVDMEMLNEEIKAYLGILSLSQSQDDFRKDMADLDETLKDNARTFLSNSDAAKENRDTIRGAMGDVARIVQQMVDEGQISADEYDLTFARMRKSVIDGFVKQGFTRKEIRAFLNAEGAWGPVIKQTGADVEDDATAAGKGIGKDIAAGLAAGLISPGALRSVNANAQRLIALAEQYARDAAESNSPSKVFARVGEDLSLGVAKGIKDKTPEVVTAASDLIGQSLRGALDAARGNRDSAMGAIRGVSDSIVGQILGNVRLSTQDAEGNALTPQQIVQALFGGLANQQAVVDSVATNIGAGLPPEILSQILTMDPTAAIALADYLGANPAMIEELKANYQALADSTALQLGVPMGLAWAKVGDQSAKEMLAAARELVKDRKDTFSAWVGSQLAVTIPVGFSAGDTPGRAAGGPVTGDSPYIVGERGPELFVPQASGSIVPNHRMTGAGGRTVNITVNAPVGADLRRAGQEIAEALRAFENGSGPIYARAS
jgi:hypothetical protein